MNKDDKTVIELQRILLRTHKGRTIDPNYGTAFDMLSNLELYASDDNKDVAECKNCGFIFYEITFANGCPNCGSTEYTMVR